MKLFHVSPQYYGKRPIFTPRVPESAADGEIETPRICLCSSVGLCYVAMQWSWSHSMFGDRGRYHVYVVETDRSVKAHRSVIDREITGERWLLEPTILTHVLKMPSIKPDYRVQSWHGEKYQRRLLREIVDATYEWEMYRKNRQTQRRLIEVTS